MVYSLCIHTRVHVCACISESVWVCVADQCHCTFFCNLCSSVTDRRSQPIWLTLMIKRRLWKSTFRRHLQTSLLSRFVQTYRTFYIHGFKLNNNIFTRSVILPHNFSFTEQICSILIRQAGFNWEYWMTASHLNANNLDTNDFEFG